MDETIVKSVYKIYFDEKNPDYKKSGLINLAQSLADSIRKIGVDFVQLVFCEHEECATAFHIDIGLSKERYRLVIEVSKLGKWAKAYWKKDLFFGTSYRDDFPNNAHRRLLVDVTKILQSHGIQLLSNEELAQEVDGIPDPFNPDDNAQLGDLLFYFDGRHS